MSRKVLIPTKLDAVARNILQQSGTYEVVQDDTASVLELARKHPDTHAIIVRSESVGQAEIDALPKLKVIIRAGAGFNTIDVKYARKKGVDVMTTPGANSNGVAEEVVAMMLADARHLISADASCRRGEWEKKKFMGREIAGKTIGIVGLGNIGRLVVRRLSGFDVRFLGYDPVFSVERAREISVELVSLETLFAQSDYVTLHLPETAETRGLVGEKLLSLMKTGATIVNCARAGVLDENAMRKVKPQKKLRLLNDVYPKDVEGPKTIADVADIMLPHLGASTMEANFNAAKRAAEELIELEMKGVTSFIVNRDIPDGLDEAYCTLANTITRLARCLIGQQTALKQIETSFYGPLEPFSRWLLTPVVAAVCDDGDRAIDASAAAGYLEEMGITYMNRKTDPDKRYGNSITIDLTGTLPDGNLRHISIRGTVAENTMMISRIDEFDKLYFEPAGQTLFFLYEDRPGVIGAIGQKLAAKKVNIEDMRNPHDSRTNRSLAILKVNHAPAEDVIADISREIRAMAAFSIKL